MARPLRIYLDTSVIGGCLDAEFAAASQRVFELASRGKLVLLISDVVVAELADAPEEVRAVLERLKPEAVEAVSIFDDIQELAAAYIRAGIVGERWLDDATHVAAATVARADAIVSWNFRHIVRLDKIKAYNQVNLAQGYGILTIVSPVEVNVDETD
jgi:predicted nucleic acid-binding protein